MTEPLLPNRHIVSGDTRPAIVRLFAALFGDRLFGARVKFAITAILACLLSYVLLAQNPWWIFGLFGRPSVPVPGGGDKLYHFIGYFGLALVFLWYSTSKSLRFALLLIGTAAVHGGATELLQQYVPGRVADLADFWMNLIGVAGGTALGLTLRRLARRDETPAEAVGIHAGDRSQLTSVTQRRRKSDSTEPLSLTREEMTGDQIAEIRFRVVDFRFLGIFVSVMLILFGSVYALHGWQVRRNARDLRVLGEKARGAGELDRAQRFYSQYVGLVPGDVNALADYGVLLDDARLSPEAGRHAFMVYENVLRTDPAREDIRRRQIHVALGLGRFTDALAHVEILRQTHPTDGDLDFLAGLCHERLVDYQAAAEAYEAAIEHAPEKVNAWSRLADLYHRNLDLGERAEEIINRLVDENAREADAWLSRARFRQHAGQIEEAAADLEKAKQLDPDSEQILLASAEIGYEKARAARSAGRDGLVERTAIQTRQLIERALKLFPENLELRLRLVVLESHFGDPKKALALIESILEKAPGESRTQVLLADLTIAQGDFERARQAIAALPRTPGSDAMRLFLEGRVAMASEKWDEASTVLTEARRFLPNSNSMAERTDLALAQCFRQLGETEDELRAYRRILKYHPESVPARLGLAGVNLLADRLPEAIAEYRPLSHLSGVRLVLVRLLIIQNLRMPEVARDWREVVELLDAARHAGDSATQEALLRAEVLTAREKYEEAQAVIETAQASHTDRVEFRLALSRLADRTGDRQRAALWLGQALAAAGSEEAETKLVEAVEASPADPQAAQALMRYYLDQDRRKDALAEFRRRAPQMSRLQLAETYALFGDAVRAAELFRLELNDEAGNVAALEGLADVLLAADRLDEAQPVLRRAIKLPETEAAASVAAARRKLAVLLSSTGQFGDWKEAVELLDANDAAQDQPRIEDVRARASVLATRSGTEPRAAAIALLERLDDRNQLTTADRWLLGRLYRDDGQDEQAAVQLQRALQHAPDAGVLVSAFIDSLLDRGELAAAAGWLDQLKKLAPGESDTVRLAVTFHALRGDLDVAKAKLTTFAHAGRKPGHEPALRLVETAQIAVHVAERCRRVEVETAALFDGLAESFLREAISQDPSQQPALVLFLMNNGRDREIAALIEPAWENLPAESAAGLSLAMIGSSAAARKKIDLVESNLRAALSDSSNANSPEARSLLQLCLADVRSLQGDFREAERLYRLILHRDRNMLPAMNNLAWLLARRGTDLDEASLLIDRAMKSAGPTPELLDTRGCVNLALGQNREAIEFLERSARESPSEITWLHLADAWNSHGDEARSTAVFKRALAAGLQRSRLHPLDQATFDALAEGRDGE